MNAVLGGVPRPPSANDTSIAIRLPEAWLRRADALIESLSTPGITVTRSDVLRAALAHGFEVLEARRDGVAPKPRGRK